MTHKQLGIPEDLEFLAEKLDKLVIAIKEVSQAYRDLNLLSQTLIDMALEESEKV